MKIILASLVIGSLMVGTALAQTSATSQSGVAASYNTSVSAGKARQRATCSLALPSGLTLETSHSHPRGTSPELSLLAPAPVGD
jgi:hypothetical protein